jgi:hypothetical protein
MNESVARLMLLEKRRRRSTAGQVLKSFPFTLVKKIAISSSQLLPCLKIPDTD